MQEYLKDPTKITAQPLISLLLQQINKMNDRNATWICIL